MIHTIGYTPDGQPSEVVPTCEITRIVPPEVDRAQSLMHRAPASDRDTVPEPRPTEMTLAHDHESVVLTSDSSPSETPTRRIHDMAATLEPFVLDQILPYPPIIERPDTTCTTLTHEIPIDHQGHIEQTLDIDATIEHFLSACEPSRSDFPTIERRLETRALLPHEGSRDHELHTQRVEVPPETRAHSLPRATSTDTVILATPHRAMSRPHDTVTHEPSLGHDERSCARPVPTTAYHASSSPHTAYHRTRQVYVPYTVMHEISLPHNDTLV